MTAGGSGDLTELADGLIDDNDLAALGRLAGLYDRADPMPERLLDAIRFTLSLDLMDAEIAELHRTAELVGTRSGEMTEAQTVTFTSASRTTMITITPTNADLARIDGWIAPGGGVRVELRSEHTSLHTKADVDGRFVFPEVPRGLVQLVVRAPAPSADPAVVTPSLEI